MCRKLFFIAGCFICLTFSTQRLLALQPGSNLNDTDHAGTDWTISVDTFIAGTHTNLGQFIINSGVIVTVFPSSTSASSWGEQRFGKVEIYASTITISGNLYATGSGWIKTGSASTGEGPGALISGSSNDRGAGGSYGGRGGKGNVGSLNTSLTYGTTALVSSPPSSDDIERGSSGMNDDNGLRAGNGGGKILLSASSITINTVNASGGNSSESGAPGGGSGGGILIDGSSLTVYNIIVASGGQGFGGAGGGGGGRVKLFYISASISQVDVVLGTGIGGTSGNSGTVHYNLKPTLPALTSPNNLFTQENQLPAFDWTDSTDSDGPDNDNAAGDGTAVTYEWQLSSSTIFVPVLLGTNPANSIFVSTFSLTRNATYYWRVKAYDQQSYTKWTDYFSLVVLDTTPPTNVSIASITIFISSVQVNLNTAVDITTGLHQNPYWIDLSTSVDFVSISSSTNWQPFTSWQFSPLIPNTTYYFRTKARDKIPNETVFLSTLTVATLTKAPEGVSFSTISVSTIGVAWTVSSPTNPVNTVYTFQASSTAFNGSGTIFSSQTVRVASSAAVGSLSPNTTYFLRVLATNWSGAISTSTILSTATIPTSPAVSGFSVFATSISVTLSANGNPDGTAVSITSGTGAGEFSVSSSSQGILSAGSAILVLTSLIPDTTYTLKARAVNYHNLPSSATVVAVATRTLISTHTVTSFSVYTTSVSITIGSNGNPPGAQIMVSTGTGGHFTVTLSSIGKIAAADTTLSIFNLVPNTTYSFQSGSVNAGGSTNTVIVTLSTVTLAVLPEVLSFTVFSTSVSVSIFPALNPSSTTLVVSSMSAFLLSASSSARSSQFCVFNVISEQFDCNVATATLSLLDLVPNTTYVFRARAVNHQESPTASVVVAATVTYAAVPGNISFTDVGFVSASITWDRNGNQLTPPTSYQVDIATWNGFSGVVTSSITYLLSVTTEGLTAGASYFFRVKAFNRGGGGSSYGQSLSTITFSNVPLPDVFSSTQVGISSITLSWTSNGNTQGTLYRAQVSTVQNFLSGIVTSSETFTLSASTVSLLPNTTYHFRVAASPFSSFSNTLSTPTLSVSPGIQSILTYTSSMSVSVAQTQNPINTKIRVIVSTGPTQIDFSSAAVVTGAITTVTITGLQPNTTFTVSAESFNHQTLVSSRTQTSTATLSAEPIVSGFAVFATSISVTLSANGNPNGTQLVISTGSSGHFAVNLSSIGKIAAAETTLSIFNLVPNTTYSFQAGSLNNSFGSTNTVIVTAATTTLGAVPTLIGFNVFATSVSVTLAANGNPDGTGVAVSTGSSGNFSVTRSSIGVFSASAVNLTITGLTPNTIYAIQAGAWNSAPIASTQSLIVIASTTTLTGPPQATGFQIFTTSAIVNSIPNGNPDGTQIVISTGTNGHFTVNLTSIGVISGANTTLTIFGLSTNTFYTLQLGSLNADGSTNTIIVTASTYTLSVPPTADSFAVYNTSLTVNLNLNTNPTGTKLEITTGSFETSTSSSGQISTLTISGLTANTTYTISARSVNVTTSASSSVLIASTSTLAFTPGSNSFNAVNITSITMSWQSNGNPLTPPTSYQVYISTESTFGVFTSSLTFLTSVSTIGLTANTSYFIKVRGFGRGGDISDFNSYISTATLAVAPTDLTITFFSPFSIQYSWSEAGNQTGTDYSAEISTSSNFLTFMSSLTKLNTAAFGNLNPNTTYYYRTGAVSRNGITSYSLSVTTTTLPIFSISGNVVDLLGSGLPSITMSLTGSATASLLTSSTGFYQFTNLVSTGTYSIIPSSFSYFNFSPSTRNYTNLQSNQVSQNFVRLSSNTALGFTGEVSYTNTDLQPTAGTYNTNFLFRISYSDPENDSLKAGYPKLHVYTATGPGGAGGLPIVGSPFTMTETDSTDTNYRDGKIYSYLLPGISTAGAYSHITEALDVFDNRASSVTIVGFPVIGSIPVLAFTGEANFASSYLSPATGVSTTTFIFRIKYTDADNDAPKSGYPRLKLFKSGTELSGSPFTLSAADTSDLIYSDGKIYFYQTTLSTGLYTFSFEAQDVFGAVASTITGVGPDITLAISGYVLDPSSAAMNNITLNLSGASTQTAITDSNGFYSFTGLSAGANYSISPSTSSFIRFATSTRTYTNLQEHQSSQNFVRLSSGPIIFWTGETNYTADGLNPEIGATTTTLIFRIGYADSDNDAPKSGYPKLHVRRGGLTVSSSPFAMSYVSGLISSTAIYSVSLKFDVLSDSYTYFFEAYDIYNSSSTWGLSVSSIAPAFTIFAQAPTIMQNGGTTRDGRGTPDGATVISTKVELAWEGTDAQGNPLTFDVYLSQPTKVSAARRYAALAAGEISLKNIYHGTNTSLTLKSLESGKTYFWRVDATNIQGVTSQGAMFSFKTLGLSADKLFNFPNPFNPHRGNTNIVFPVNEAQTVELKIFSVFGELVYTNTISAEAGTNLFVWDGRDNNGGILFNGYYTCLIRKKDGSAKTEIMVVK